MLGRVDMRLDVRKMVPVVYWRSILAGKEMVWWVRVSSSAKDLVATKHCCESEKTYDTYDFLLLPSSYGFLDFFS